MCCYTIVRSYQQAPVQLVELCLPWLELFPYYYCCCTQLPPSLLQTPLLTVHCSTSLYYQHCCFTNEKFAFTLYDISQHGVRHSSSSNSYASTRRARIIWQATLYTQACGGSVHSLGYSTLIISPEIKGHCLATDTGARILW